MTHDELLEVINKYHSAIESGSRWEPDCFIKALRSVVELHKPFDYELAPDVYKLVCTNCQMGAVEQYPCQTIQAIEKELG